eukprot:c29686_g1_i1 orf=113-529(+)
MICDHIEDLQCGMDMVKEEIEWAISDESDCSKFRDRFLALAHPFYLQLTTDMMNLKTLATFSFNKLRDLARYFGESCDKHRQMDLLKILCEFLCMFDRVRREIQDHRQKEEEINLKIQDPGEQEEADKSCLSKTFSSQ